MNGYIIFIKTNRRNIINKHFPNDTPRECFTKVAKKGSEMWNNLSEKEKNVYNNKAKSNMYKSKKNNSKSNKRKKTKSSKKRKLTAYVNWFLQNRQKIIDEHFPNQTPKEYFTKVGKKAGEIWRSMDNSEKNKFK